MHRGRLSRRTVLLSAGTAVVAGLAGCTGSSDSGSPTTTTIEETTKTSGGEETPTTEPHDPVSIDGAPYSLWMPEAGTFKETHHYGFSAVNFQEIAERSDTVPSGLEQSPHVSGWQPVDIDWQDVSLSLFFQRNFVIRGGYDADAVTEAVVSHDAWSRETVGDGNEVIVKNDGSKAIGVSDEAIVISPTFGEDDDAAENVQQIVDTVAGNRVRYIGANDVMYDLVAELRDGTIVQGRTMQEVEEGNVSEGQFPGQVGRGRWGQYRDDATDVKIVVAYAGESDVDVADLETFVDENDDEFGAWNGLEVSQNGRLGVISGTLDRGSG